MPPQRGSVATLADARCTCRALHAISRLRRAPRHTVQVSATAGSAKGPGGQPASSLRINSMRLLLDMPGIHKVRLLALHKPLWHEIAYERGQLGLERRRRVRATGSAGAAQWHGCKPGPACVLLATQTAAAHMKTYGSCSCVVCAACAQGPACYDALSAKLVEQAGECAGILSQQCSEHTICTVLCNGKP